MDKLRRHVFAQVRKSSDFAKIREVRERFICGEAVEPQGMVRSLIVERWQRCRELGINPCTQMAPMKLSYDELCEILKQEDLGRAGTIVLEDFAHLVEGTGHVMVLADVHGRILYEVGHRGVGKALEAINFQAGSLWAEAVVGPNGVGTPIALALPNFVFGPEHFCEGWQPWVCYGAPIRNLETGQTLGGVDITGPARSVEHAVFDLTVSIARSIERLLIVPGFKRRQTLLDAYLNAQRRWPKEGLIVVDEAGRIVELNTLAVEFFKENFQALLGYPLEQRLPELEQLRQQSLRCGEQIEATVDLPAARGRLCSVHCSPMVAESKVIGVLFVLEAPPLHSRQRPSIPKSVTQLCTFAEILGTNPQLQSMLHLARIAAASDKSVLIAGETGTGKELVAQAIHAASPRANGPFIAINCAALPRELAESELFGYGPGTFTGARREGFHGRFEMAQGGTIFLDEICSMSPEMQSKLLRVLETKMLVKLGCQVQIPLDVRVIAASDHKVDLRPALFYRLATFHIHLPPLRERLEDLPLLASSFLNRECERLGRVPPRLCSAVVEKLQRYHWPGNVRELRNLCERWAHCVEKSEITMDDLPTTILTVSPAGPISSIQRFSSLEEVELALILQTLEETGGNILETARRLGVSRKTIYRRLKQAGKL